MFRGRKVQVTRLHGVFWDTGSQVTLVTQKAAHTLGLTAIPSSPLRLEGIGEGHRP